MDKFRNIFRSFKRKRMQGMIPEYSKMGIIEEEFEEMRPYLEKAYQLGIKDKGDSEDE